MKTDKDIIKSFSQGDINLTFWSIVEIASNREGKLNQQDDFGTEANPALYGGVEFWRDSSGSWCYSVPTNQWDHAAITNDLMYFF